MSLPIFLGTADGVDSSAQHDQHEKNLSDPCRVAKLTAFFYMAGKQQQWKYMGIKGHGKIMELHVGNFPAILIIKWKKV